MATVVDSIAATVAATVDCAGELTVIDADAAPVESLSWAAVHERARRFAAVLGRRGIGRGARIGLLGDSTLDTVTAVQAVWLAGAAVTVLPPATRPAAITEIVADAGLHLVVAQNPAALNCEVWALSEWVRQAATTSAAPTRTTPPRPDPADLAILQYTSGSTSRRRGVPVTHAHLAANLDAIRAATGHDALHPARILSWLPLYHDMGLIGFLAYAMACGCSLFLQDPAAFARRPASWLQAMSRYRVTMSGAPNLAYALTARMLARGLDVDLSSVRFLLSGAEPIDAAVMDEFAEAGRRHGLASSALVAAYGLAESTLAVTFSPMGTGIRTDPPPGEAFGRALVRCGFPVPGTTVRVVDERTGAPVAPQVPGRIEIRGPSVVGHYWGQDPPAPGTWFRTDDLGYLTCDDGELVVCGRVNDVLFAAGRNIFPQDVEAAATAVAGVRVGGVAAFGIPGANGDSLVVAVESRGVNPLVLQRQVRLAVLDKVGLSPVTVLTLPVGRLPKTSSGKIRRSEARRRFLSGSLSGGPAETRVDTRTER